MSETNRRCIFRARFKPNRCETIRVDVENNGVRSTARKRWSILAEALTKRHVETNDASVRRFTSFDLLSPSLLSGNWYLYKTNDKRYEMRVYHLRRPFTAHDLIGFNNTGNICIWPSEETLAMFCLENLTMFSDKTVLELGGGMSCLAGLMVAKYSNTTEVHLTDGNRKSIENVKAIANVNGLNDNVLISLLQWQMVDCNSPKYDIVLVADCLFFEEVRLHLINTIWHSITDDGVAYVMAPERGHTLLNFVRESEKFGLKCNRVDKYCDIVWKRHVELIETDANYDPNLHYPVLLKLVK